MKCFLTAARPSLPRPRRRVRWVLAAAAAPLLLASAEAAPKTSAAPPAELIIDAVVASVNEQPITLSDVERRLASPTTLTLQEISTDPRARQVIDGLILERLIEAEAAQRKMTVSDSEIDRYVSEIAQRNNLSVEAFKKALAEEKRDFTEYRQQVKADILRTRLSAAVMQSGVAVTQTEVEEYLAEHPELSRTGAKLKLRQIFVDGARHSDGEAAVILEKAKARIDGGEDFRAVAEAVSESPDGKDGGLLGVVAEKDLSSEIFDAVFALKAGSASPPTRTSEGWHIFWVDERFSETDSAESERLMDEVRKTLHDRKSRTRLETYFTTELYKAHSVDRKI